MWKCSHAQTTARAAHSVCEYVCSTGVRARLGNATTRHTYLFWPLCTRIAPGPTGLASGLAPWILSPFPHQTYSMIGGLTSASSSWSCCAVYSHAIYFLVNSLRGWLSLEQKLVMPSRLRIQTHVLVYLVPGLLELFWSQPSSLFLWIHTQIIQLCSCRRNIFVCLTSVPCLTVYGILPCGLHCGHQWMFCTQACHHH